MKRTVAAILAAVLLSGCTVVFEVGAQFVDWRSPRAEFHAVQVSMPESDRAAAQASRDYWTGGRSVSLDERLFWIHCSNCHGDRGFGTMNNNGTVSAPSLHSSRLARRSEESLAEFIFGGRPSMPAFGSAKGLTDADRLALARLIREWGAQ